MGGVNIDKQARRSVQHSHRNGATALAALLWIAIPTAGLTQSPPTDLDHFHSVIAPQINAIMATHPPPGSPEAKINTQLLAAARQQRNPGEQVEVDIVAHVTPQVTAQITGLGGSIINQFPRDRAIRAKLPLSALIPLAALPDVKTILPAIQSKRNQGTPAQSAIAVEGDKAHRADVARSTYDVDGSGVKVCVISDTINAAGPGTPAPTALDIAVAAQAVPPRAQISLLPIQSGFGIGEGLAMLEIIHKIAPGASLGFATYHPTPAQMAQNIRDLAHTNCKVIVDDASFLAQPVFQDGAISQAIKEVVDAGVVYISSSGNFGNFTRGSSSTWEGDFKKGSPDPRFNSLVDVHQFGSALPAIVKSAHDPKNPKTKIALYWNDEWFDAKDTYVVFVFDKNDQVLASSQATGLPFVLVDMATNQAPLRGYLDLDDKIYVVKTTASQGKYLRLDAQGATLDVGTAGSTSTHNAAAAAITVAAVNPPNPPAPFGAGTTVHRASSDGKRRMFFRPDGTPDDHTLDKPDLAAAHCVTTTFPLGTTADPNPLNPFCGTSAAAPHVAGIAALLLSFRPSLTPAQVREILIHSGIDIETEGWDNLSGYGIPMADKALANAVFMNWYPYALEFNDRSNSPSYAEVRDPKWNPGTNLTLEASVYWNGATGYVGIISHTTLYPPPTPSSGDSGYMLALSDGKPMLKIVTTSRADRSGAMAKRPLPVNVWTTVAATYDGQRSIIYVNGEEVGRSEWAGVEGVSSGCCIYLGSERGSITAIGPSPTSPRAFGGRLAEVRIWDRALSAQTIDTWKGRGIFAWDPHPHPNTDALVARWDLQFSGGEIATDDSWVFGRTLRHSRDATLRNGARFVENCRPFLDGRC